MKFEELVTSRLILRKITHDILDRIYQNLSESDQLKYLGLKSIEELKVERKKYEDGLSTHNRKFLYFQILLKEDPKIIGWCGYHTWYIEHQRAELGYGLFKDAFKNKGIMTEATIPIIEFGFKEMKLNRIEAFIGLENEASLKLINKLQFVKEGLLRQHFCNKNKIEDSVVYSLLQSEYE